MKVPNLWIAMASTGLSVPALICFGQPYAIESFTVDGGGGTSTGGNYTITGTIGQPDASGGVQKGGNFTLEGGFWPGLAVVPIPDGPTLAIVSQSDAVRLSWIPATPGYVLEQSESLSQDTWSSAPSGSQNPVTIQVGERTRFFRLVKH